LSKGLIGGWLLLSERQTARISPHFPLSHGIPQVDDRRVVREIIYAIPQPKLPRLVTNA